MNHHIQLPRPGTAAYARRLNEAKTCCAHGCNQHRAGLERWCAVHRTPARKYGHPHGKAIKPAEYRDQTAAVDKLIAQNLAHSGVVNAAAHIQRLMDLAMAERQVFFGSLELQRVARHGVTAVEVLKRAAAFNAFARVNARLFPDQKAIDFAMSHAVFGLAPRPRKVVYSGTTVGAQYSVKPRVSALRSFGRRLREDLAPLFAHIARTVEEREAAKVAARNALHQPFEQAPESPLEDDTRPLIQLKK